MWNRNYDIIKNIIKAHLERTTQNNLGNRVISYSIPTYPIPVIYMIYLTVLRLTEMSTIFSQIFQARVIFSRWALYEKSVSFVKTKKKCNKLKIGEQSL